MQALLPCTALSQLAETVKRWRNGGGLGSAVGLTRADAAAPRPCYSASPRLPWKQAPPLGASVMRYKVRAPNDAVLDEIEVALQGKVEIFLISRRRHYIATGDLSRELIQELEAGGAKVLPDYQFSSDASL